MQWRLLLDLQARQFSRYGLPPHSVLLHPALQPVVQFQNAFFDSLEQLGFGLFNFPQFSFQLLGALGVLPAILAHIPPVSVDHVPNILGRVNFLAESVEDQVVKNIHPVGF